MTANFYFQSLYTVTTFVLAPASVNFYNLDFVPFVVNLHECSYGSALSLIKTKKLNIYLSEALACLRSNFYRNQSKVHSKFKRFLKTKNMSNIHLFMYIGLYIFWIVKKLQKKQPVFIFFSFKSKLIFTCMLNLILIPCFRTSPKYRRYEFIKLIFLLPSIFYKYNLQSALFKELRKHSDTIYEYSLIILIDEK